MKKAVTLTEIVVGTLILATAFGGLLATFIGVRKYITRANKRLVANYLAKGALDNLYREVSPTWDTPGGYNLTAGTRNLPDYTIDTLPYGDTAGGSPNTYQVVDLTAGGHDYRQVTVTINHPTD